MSLFRSFNLYIISETVTLLIHYLYRSLDTRLFRSVALLNRSSQKKTPTTHPNSREDGTENTRRAKDD